MHTGDSRYDNSNPNRLLPVMEIYSDLTVIGAHFGGYSIWEEASKKLCSLPNLYVDTCSSFFAFFTFYLLICWFHPNIYYRNQKYAPPKVFNFWGAYHLNSFSKNYSAVKPERLIPYIKYDKRRDKHHLRRISTCGNNVAIKTVLHSCQGRRRLHKGIGVQCQR